MLSNIVAVLYKLLMHAKSCKIHTDYLEHDFLGIYLLAFSLVEEWHHTARFYGYLSTTSNFLMSNINGIKNLIMHSFPWKKIVSTLVLYTSKFAKKLKYRSESIYYNHPHISGYITKCVSCSEVYFSRLPSCNV